jgi:tetratricopeptide (TPR) repeat protein
MTLWPSLLRELENPDLGVDGRAALCCKLTRELENKGEYDQARKVLGNYWQRIGEPPKVADLEPNTAAEVLLRAGVLTGIIGSHRQITDAQEKAKDLLTESHSLFESQQNNQKLAEARTELALCYWRTDELNEARDCLREALSLLTEDSELKAKAILRLSIVEHSAGHDPKAFRILTKHAPLFHSINNHTLRGSYYVTLGNRLENLAESRSHRDYIDRALIEYAAASYHFERAEHRPYLANVETNLGFLYFKINRFDEAHEHLDRARRIYVSIKDARTAAQVDETRARTFLAQGRITEAERVAGSVVRVQEKGGTPSLLAEALITHGKTLARSDRYGAALFAFRRAVELSEQTGNSGRAAEAALVAFQELGEHLAVAERGQFSSGRALVEDRRSMEREVIKLALEQANGSVTHAARSLGMSWQGLAYTLRTRHKDLLEVRTPVRPRRRKQGAL